MEKIMVDQEPHSAQTAYALYLLGRDSRYKQLNDKLMTAFEQMRGVAGTITDPDLSARLTALINEATQSQEALKEEFGFKIK